MKGSLNRELKEALDITADRESVGTATKKPVFVKKPVTGLKALEDKIKAQSRLKGGGIAEKGVTPVFEKKPMN
jgi:hypothetical protein